MMTAWPSGAGEALAISGLAALLGLVGLWLATRADRWELEHPVPVAGFTAGILLGAAFLHLLPEALQRLVLIERAVVWGGAAALGGYLMMTLATVLVSHARAAEVAHQEAGALAMLPIIGIGLHALTDGIAYAVGAEAKAAALPLLGLGLTLHKIPEALVAHGLVREGGGSPRQAILVTLLAVVLATPVGTLAALPFVAHIGPAGLAMLMAATAGALVQIAASHLLPHVEHEPGRGGGPAFLVGLAVALAGAFLLGHA